MHYMKKVYMILTDDLAPMTVKSHVYLPSFPLLWAPIANKVRIGIPGGPLTGWEPRSLVNVTRSISHLIPFLTAFN